MSITWVDRVANLTKALGRDPTVEELYEVATIHQMTPAEIEAQRASWVRRVTARCDHGKLNFGQCSECQRLR